MSLCRDNHAAVLLRFDAGQNFFGMKAVLYQLAVVKPEDLIGTLSEFLVVSNDHCTVAVIAGQRFQDTEGIRTVFGVQLACGFVRQEDLCLHTECPGNGYPLLLTAGKHGGETIQHLIRKADLPDEPGGALFRCNMTGRSCLKYNGYCQQYRKAR